MADTIPLRNIWVLFLYAADLVQFRDRFDQQVEAARDLPDLVARLLTHVVEERLCRNLSRGYRPQAETLSRVRGRIDMLATTTGSLMDRGLIACRYEAHTMDTARNRLVRAALEYLAPWVTDDLTAHRCRQLAGDFILMGVTGTRPSRADLATDQIGRNESSDRFMVALASMVFDILIPSEEHGQTGGLAPDREAALVRRLFEKAVGNALRITLQPKGWRIIQGRRLSWPTEQTTPGMAAILPGMQTDIDLTHHATGRRIIIDTKFTAILTSSAYRDQILKSGYLYQLYTYVRSQERLDDPISLTTEGMLLHPQIGGAIDEEMVVQGHKMRFTTINLTGPANEFERALEHIPSRTP
jgi:5-methylcytosine-specific restriction enzyme subunit McrC